MTAAISLESYVGKFTLALLKLPLEIVNDFLNNPKDYAFDVNEEKFFKISETQLKTVEGASNLVKELNDGWQLDKIVNPGEYPGKYRVRKRNYLSSSTSL